MGGRDVPKILKYRNVQANPKLALVVDDLESIRPWHPRGLRFHGTADFTTRQGYAGTGTYIRIKPHTKRSWGIE